jgi:biotin operon repressor
MSARANQTKDADQEPRGAYGYVLVLRALASAAITIGDQSPAALRVLCVLAEYVNQDGICSVSQDTIAARLNISRQAVNRQIKWLDDAGILAAGSPTPGKVLRYVIDTEPFEHSRTDEWRVEKRRKDKRDAKKVQRADVAGVKRLDVAGGAA